MQCAVQPFYGSICIFIFTFSSHGALDKTDSFFFFFRIKIYKTNFNRQLGNIYFTKIMCTFFDQSHLVDVAIKTPQRTLWEPLALSFFFIIIYRYSYLSKKMRLWIVHGSIINLKRRPKIEKKNATRRPDGSCWISVDQAVGLTTSWSTNRLV